MQTIALGRYVAAAPTLLDGEAFELRLTAAGELVTAGSVTLSPLVPYVDDTVPGAIYPVAAFVYALDEVGTADRCRVRVVLNTNNSPAAAIEAAAFNLGRDYEAPTWRPLRCDVQGTRTATSWKPAVTPNGAYVTVQGFTGAANLRALPTQLVAVVASSMNPRSFLLLFNKNTPPVAGDVPAFFIAVDASGKMGRETFGDQGAHFTVGLSFGWSTTPNIYTAAAPALGTVGVFCEIG